MIRNFSRTLVASFFSGLLFTSPALAAPRAESAWLTQAEAQARATRVSQVDYAIVIDVTGAERFTATSTVGFDLKDTAEALTLDLDKAAIVSLTVNRKTVTPQYNGWFITLAAKHLAPGRNTVAVSYSRAYNTNGEGLHRMVDAADGKAYLYSQLAPANAHQVFALFDQPDMKAAYALTVTAPADWQVVSAARESSIADIGATRRWTFPATKKLSAYAFSLHAGPYKVWEDNSGAYPLRLFARQSVAAHVNAADWFRYTQQGFAFFDQYFGIPYQFGKYDQLLVPDHLYGAMENIGAVTFAERNYLHQGPQTAAQRDSMARVIMHEMAHQWFGDLVTMEWWNGLWLSESFASFMASLALADAPELSNAWLAFFIDDKLRGYALDAGPGSHAVDAPIASSANAYDNLDAITYIKGGSALKQLRHLLGDEAFRTGVRNYLAKNQFGNARLDDFIGELGKAAGRDLGPWTRQWLYEAGLNTIAADYSCRKGKIAAFTLRQGTVRAGQPVLREQRVQVATFVMNHSSMALDRNIAVSYRGAATAVPEMVGGACPDLVYPNYQDWGFVKVRLDKRSMATARAHMAAIDDSLLRAMLWQGLWDAVRDGRYRLPAFMATAMRNASAEKDRAVLRDLLKKLDEGAAYRTGPSAAAAQAAWVAMQESDTSFNGEWLKLYQNTISGKQDLNRVAAILAGEIVIPGVPLNQDLRWGLIATLNRYGAPSGAALIAAELKRDNTDSGNAAALRATLLRPDPAVKAAWLAKIVDLKTTEPFARIRIAMANLFPAGQEELAETSAAQRLRRLPELDKAASPAYMRAYGAAMIPASCTAASVARLKDAIAGMKELSPATGRALRGRYEQDRRCVAIQR